MGDGEPVLPSWAVARPAPPLRGLVSRYVGYRYVGVPAGVHLGMPSASLTVVLGLNGPTRTVRMPDPRQPPADLDALVGGLHTAPALIATDGTAEGVQFELTPAGARSLLGLPAGALGPLVLPLGDVLPAATELLARLAAAPAWPHRFAVLDEVLVRHIGRLPPAAAAVQRAWALLSTGTARVSDVAAEVGWSRRHLGERFAREHGLPPKQLARVARFDRSRQLVMAGRRLADVAASCGYVDQAHLTREWVALAGVPPAAWLRAEQLSFVQDEVAVEGARSAV